MSNEVMRIAHKYSAAAKVEMGGIRGRHCVHVDILTADERLGVFVEFDGDSRQPNVFVLPWHLTMSSPTGVYLAPRVFDFQVNEYHGAKATLVREGFVALCDHLDAVLAAATNGSAYTTERPPRAVRAPRNDSFVLI